MAKLPTIKEMAEEVAKEALEMIYTEKPELKEIKEAYEQGKADVINDCIKDLEQCYPLVDNGDILYGFSCAIQRLKQLKEQK